jgi:hypothetical protein
MKKYLITLVALVASANIFANITVSASYGILNPSKSQSEWGNVAQYNGDVATFTLEKPKFIDIAVNSSRNIGFTYSSTVNDVKLTPKQVKLVSVNPAFDNSTFAWNYRAVFATYSHRLNNVFAADVAIGAIEQNLKNTTPAIANRQTKSMSRDFGARLGISATCDLSHTTNLTLSARYDYFKDFEKTWSLTDGSNKSSPVIKPRGLSVILGISRSF